jgi:hypothetical protein
MTASHVTNQTPFGRLQEQAPPFANIQAPIARHGPRRRPAVRDRADAARRLPEVLRQGHTRELHRDGATACMD